MSVGAAAIASSREWRPHAGPQTAFLRAPVYELLYGGSAGGGKTVAQVAAALRYVHVPGYHAVIFRRTHPELERSVMPEARQWYPALGGKWSERKFAWTFPSGAVIRLCHLERDSDKQAHDGSEYAFIGFDELTSFLESQYLFMHSRARSTAIDPRTGRPLPVLIRATTNPGGVGHEWVRRRWWPWLGDDAPARAGEVRWYDGETEVARGSRNADGDAPHSRTFIRARLEDNPTLMKLDPGYRARLNNLSLLDRQAKKDGRWDLVASGNVFRAEWLQQRVSMAPEGLRWCRFWDLASVAKRRNDNSATLSGAMHSGRLYVRRGWAGREDWPDQVRRIRRYLRDERDSQHGIENQLHCTQMIQQLRDEPEAAAADLDAIVCDKDKLSRAMPASRLAGEGRLVFVEDGDAGWIQEWISEMIAFDGSGAGRDDRVDALSGVCQMLGVGREPALSGPMAREVKHKRWTAPSRRR